VINIYIQRQHYEIHQKLFERMEDEREREWEYNAGSKLFKIH
jgi:hypothetical protein